MGDPSSQRMMIAGVRKRAQASVIKPIGVGCKNVVDERLTIIQGINAVRV